MQPYVTERTGLLSTAHRAKFAEVIEDALGRDFPLPDALERFLGKEKVFTPG